MHQGIRVAGGGKHEVQILKLFVLKRAPRYTIYKVARERSK